MICSASDFSSSGLSGALSSDTNSPFTRIVAGRPTFKSRSDALRWTIRVMAALKLKVGALWGASGMGVDSEKGLSELDGLGALRSEERRVGKEGRCGRWRCTEKKKANRS